MKSIKIFLTVCLMHITHSHCMEIEQLSLWYLLPKENVTQIVACSDVHTKESLRLVNKQLSLIACKKNIKNLLHHFPCILSRKNHLDCMVKYAKENNIKMMRRLIKTAAYCDHANWFDVIPYFLPEYFCELILLKEYDSFSHINALKELLPCTMMVYGGDSKALEQYKINHEQIHGHPLHDDPSLHRHKITPLHVAAERKHPISIAQLLLTQDLTLLNTMDDYGRAPIVVAACSNAVDMCKFLLSCKHIDLTKVKHPKCTALKQACRQGHLEIVKLLIDYHNKHAIQDMNNGYDLCMVALQANKVDTLKFLLDSIPIQALHAFDLFDYACTNSSIEIIEILLEKLALDINAIHDKTFQTWGCNHLFEVIEYTVSGVTVLYSAAQYSKKNVVEFLLNNGADPDIADTHGKKPIDVARTDEIRALLLNKMKQD